MRYSRLTGVNPISTLDYSKFDLGAFNQKYFEELRKACSLLRKHGFIVHLQLWQAVTWKKSWQGCYYNPKNNVNPDISAQVNL